MKFLIIPLLFASLAGAQTVSVSASHFGGLGTEVSGTIYWQPALVNGQVASFHQANGGIVTVKKVQATVTAGVFTLTLPDTSLTTPKNVCYIVTAINSANNQQALGPGFTCVQPHGTSTGAGDWCAVGVCNFDNYAPNLPSLPTQYINVSGSYLPLTGGMLTGPLILSGDPTDELQAATKEYVDENAGGSPAVGPANAIQTSDGSGHFQGTANAEVDSSGNLTITSLAVNNPIQAPNLFIGAYNFMGTGPVSNTILAAAFASADTTMSVASTTGYPDQGYALVGSNNFSGEIVEWTAKTATTFTGLTRSLFGTTAPSTNAVGGSIILIDGWIAESTSASPKVMSFWHGPIALSPDATFLGSSCCTGPGVVVGTSLTMFGQEVSFAGGGGIYGTVGGIGVRDNSTSVVSVDDAGISGLATNSLTISASTTSISPTTGITYLSGAAPTALATIVLPSGDSCATSGITCTLQFMTEVGLTTVNTGNISTVLNKTAGQLMTCTYDKNLNKWM